MRKIINDPEQFVDEVIDGILLAHPERLRAAQGDRRALVRRDAGTGGRVGIVTGGGSGHLPLFLGYVGTGLASGVAVGNVFSSPSPEQVHRATVASDDGAGVLYLYGNYGGDVYTFDLGADLSAADGIRTTTVVGTDDLLSAPANRAETRRGVAGLFFAYKTAGAAAERGDDLDTVTEIARRTCERTRTMGVGLSPTILPAAGEPTFTLDEGEMEIGIGIHGEPGQHRGPLETADQITDRFLAELLTELPVTTGDSVAVLVNGLGATPLEELYVIYRRIHQVLTERGAEIAHVYIGEYATSLEMAGASVSLCHLDDELSELLAAPADSPFFEQAAGARGPRPEVGTEAAGTEQAATDEPERVVRTVQDPGNLRSMLLAITEKLPDHSEELRALDAALGDGDLGITVGSGAKAVHRELKEMPEDAAAEELLRAAGTAFAAANPSTFAALIGGAALAAAEAAGDRVDRDRLEALLEAFTGRIAERGGAQRGDKTVLDVLHAIGESLALEGDPGHPADRARIAVEQTIDAFAAKPSRRGRAAWVGERSIGHRDPGQVAVLRFLDELCAVLDRDA
ncbi:dihydroxyacetone kinase [Brachybacterium muris]|uniref:dihydroxyacetone kinase family protein n=1 Tax=Brachybacterium muris TaxID=219301 RepID=UPI00195BC1AD|nr:dihydroxyacetone kinase family protein [Brachybacterium muris]MBM7502442.1 dihydroxyacetone kinase [Brachybacterium muris]MCT1429409.1 dihydroxyacetone kinase family protein [Brachybacterium muris]